jgi:hypothetical protein
MMHEIHISKLSEIKSVFNSYSDNEQYYKVLKKSGLNSIGSVELAQPLVRKSNSTIIWKAESVENAVEFNSLNAHEKGIASHELQSFFQQFKAKTEKFKNISSDFSDKIIQIPDLGSIYYDSKKKKVVIVNWGFLEDSFNRKEGLINTLFPKQSNSILVKVIDQNENAVSNIEVELATAEKRIVNSTNDNGYANFKHLPKGTDFTVNLINYAPKLDPFNFSCDGRREYVISIKIDTDEDLTNQQNPVLPNEDNNPGLNIDEHQKNKEFNAVKNDVTLQFVNLFNKPIKYLNLTVIDGQQSQYQTNENGEIFISKPASSVQISCTHKKTNWSSEINLVNSEYHIVKLKPKYPWLWWLLIALLSYLLICCLFFNCLCADIDKSTVKEEVKEEKEVEETIPNSLACNSENRSGGDGITTNIYNLGDKNGIVYINYDMQSVPDKLEVFYQNKLVASTYDVPGNKDGFVGGALGTSCCGTISFNYIKDRDDFCKIVVSGNDQTVWAYSISCPE